MTLQRKKGSRHFLVFPKRHDIAVLHLRSQILAMIDPLKGCSLPFCWRCPLLLDDPLLIGIQRRIHRQRPEEFHFISIFLRAIVPFLDRNPKVNMADSEVQYLIVVLRPKTQDKNLLLWILGDLFNVIPSGLGWDPAY